MTKGRYYIGDDGACLIDRHTGVTVADVWEYDLLRDIRDFLNARHRDEEAIKAGTAVEVDVAFHWHSAAFPHDITWSGDTVESLDYFALDQGETPIQVTRIVVHKPQEAGR